MDESITLQSQVEPTSSISHLLSTLPSISFNGQGGQFQVNSIRGSSRWRVLTRFNQAVIHTDRRAGVSTSFIDPDFIDQISVRKGGTATQFGSGALSGVISMDSSQFDTNWLSARAESNGSHLKISTGLSSHGWSVGLSHSAQNNGKSSNAHPLNNEFQQAAFYVNKQWSLSKDWELQLTGLHSQGKDIGKTNNEDFLAKKHTIYPREKHTILQLQANSNDMLQAGISFHIQNLETLVTRFNKRTNAVANQSDDIFIFLRKDWELPANQTLSLNYEWDARLNVEALETEKQLSNSNSFIKEALQGEQHTHALVLTWQKQWENLTVLAGVRSNFLEQKNTTNALTASQTAHFKESAQFNTGYINFSYQLSPQTTIMSSFGSSFRFPTLSERFFSGTTGRGELIGNAQLVPEESINAELGIQHVRNMHSIRAAIYHNNVDNFIERVAISDEIQQFQNRDSGKVYGIEGTWRVQLATHWQYQLSADWQRSERTSSNTNQRLPLADTAPANLRSIVTYEADELSFELQHNHRFAFNHPANGEVALPAISTLSASATWQFSKHTHLAFWINNVTNREFLTTADDKSTFALGRRFGISIYWQQK